MYKKTFIFFGTLKALNEAAFHSWLPCTQVHQAFYCLRPGAVSAALQEVRSGVRCDYQQVAQVLQTNAKDLRDEATQQYCQTNFFSLLIV